MEEESLLNCLPSDIRLNIFSRLPAELVLDCKRVCRAWRNLIHLHANTDYFSNLHLRCQNGSHGLVQQEPHKPSNDGIDSAKMSFISCFDRKDLYYAEYYDDGKMNPRKACYSTKRISLKFLVGDVGLVGSCNGLICLSVKKSYNKPNSFTYRDCYDESFYICNLIIGEVVNLPGICVRNKQKTVHGFGYHPQTNEYKVLRISYEHPNKGRVEVYTLGSGSGWRSKGEINHQVLPNIHAKSVCVNGALHWLQEGSEDIVAFDLAEEEFQLLQTPCNGKQELIRRRLGIFRGCLVLVIQFIQFEMRPLHLWFLKKNKEANSSYNNTKDFYAVNPCWSKEDTVPIRSIERMPRLVAVLEGGQVLLMDNLRGHVFRYSLESQIPDDNWNPCSHSKSWAVPIPHRNTFVSLKALGEENVGTFTADGELKFPNSGKRKTGVIKIATTTTTEM